MSGRSHQRGLHHHQHPSAVAGDASGWVESIGALGDEHAATSLLLGSPPCSTGLAANGSAAVRGPEGPVGANGLTEDEAAQLSPEQEFEACLEHALACMIAEVGMPATTPAGAEAAAAAGTAAGGSSRQQQQGV